MAPKKNRVCKGVLELAPILFILEIDVLFVYIKSF